MNNNIITIIKHEYHDYIHDFGALSRARIIDFSFWVNQFLKSFKQSNILQFGLID